MEYICVNENEYEKRERDTAVQREAVGLTADAQEKSENENRKKTDEENRR